MITITESADNHLNSFAVRERRIIEAGMLKRLPHQPTRESKAIRRLRPNPLAEFEPRVGSFRVLYNVDEENAQVIVLAVGQKIRNKLFVAGEEFHGHEGNSH